MAARRLVIVMLVLLAISTIGAALIPPPGDDESGTSDDPGQATRDPQPPAEEKEPAESEPKLVAAEIVVSGMPPKTIALAPGDQLRLLVTAPFGDDIVIPAFGLTETVSESGPARFDLFIDRAGTFEVRTLSSDRLVGRIQARAASRISANGASRPVQTSKEAAP